MYINTFLEEIKTKNIFICWQIINNAIWLTPFPLAALSQLFYAINRSALFDFFNHWEETCLEYNASTDDAASSHKVVEKQLCPRLFYIYLLT